MVILTGAGRAFSAGGDLNILDGSIGPSAARDYVLEVSEITKLICNMEKPVIAAVNGLAIGGGLSFVLAADFVIASSEAKFCQAFVQVGLVPDLGGTYFLPRIVGMLKAKELIFTGKTIDAFEAERIGIVNKVVDPGSLQEAVEQLSSQLAQGPSSAIGLTKSLLNRNINRCLDEALEDEAFAQSICMQTQDHREGVRAVREKRKPRFIGA
ncbi:enoyl-CoA hydratase-related protein [Desulfallas sp. Bu1-1]|uniref:enoyl-CoA hydratase/isomerase family protein n=1 Tax=Desulfallas sp. Bu1-1 TaxID=2787620 RepID=UPI0028BDFEEB|nr:enoyl-CoA hydratase-related protein [Desulfallas sp. Bu1-1]